MPLTEEQRKERATALAKADNKEVIDRYLDRIHAAEIELPQEAKDAFAEAVTMAYLRGSERGMVEAADQIEQEARRQGLSFNIFVHTRSGEGERAAGE
jgi:hypothetical protein